MNDPALPAVLAGLATLDATLALAEGLRQGRRAVDLSGIEAEVGGLCLAALALPARARGEVRAPLEGLRRRLERLLAER
ncbi:MULTISPECIES: hypothetical protein [Acetobacterales]|uniref:hypothetical protein n=1 Tax=Roseomonas sp. WGS1072 TaxID=3366816 RepID=UPI003BF1CB8B